MEAKAFYSRLGNRRYVLLPFKFPRQPVCNLINNEYRYYMMHMLHKYSNFPYSDNRNVDLCDAWSPVNISNIELRSVIEFTICLQGLYYIQNFTFDKTIILPFHPAGKYEVIYLFYRKGEPYSCKGVTFHAVLS